MPSATTLVLYKPLQRSLGVTVMAMEVRLSGQSTLHQSQPAPHIFDLGQYCQLFRAFGQLLLCVCGQMGGLWSKGS